MQSNHLSRESNSDRVFAIFLAAFSMFVVGYSATRVFLNQATTNPVTNTADIVPHQASLWSDLGK